MKVRAKRGNAKDKETATVLDAWRKPKHAKMKSGG